MSFKDFYVLMAPLCFIFFYSPIFAQVSSTQEDGKVGNFISTAVPFLLIAPDARGSSLGNSGVSSDPDLNSIYWNPAKLVQINSDYGVSSGYMPWLRKLYPGMYLANLSGFKKVDDYKSIGFAIDYFTLGKTVFKDASGYQNGLGYPNEFSLAASYAQEFGPGFSLGLSLKYIRSDLSNGQLYEGRSIGVGNDVAFDFSFYYKALMEARNPRQFAIGLAISNLGPKISYGNNETAFIPTNFRFGMTYGVTFNQTNSICIGLEVNKLLVPTPPIYDTSGHIVSGRSPDRSVLSGIVGSFSDAPGGFKENLQEFSFAPSIEYTYEELLSLRAGVYLENKNKGNRKFSSFGFGLKVKNNLKLDFAYLVPFSLYSPLDNTLQVSLGLQF